MPYVSTSTFFTQRLTGATLLVFANKQDLPGALKADEIKEAQKYGIPMHHLNELQNLCQPQCQPVFIIYQLTNFVLCPITISLILVLLN